MNKLGKQNADKQIGIYDVLSDIVYSLSMGKYKDMFVVKGGYALASALIAQKLDSLVRATIDIDSFNELYSKVWCFTCPIFEYLIYKKENRYWDVKGWCWLAVD